MSIGVASAEWLEVFPESQVGWLRMRGVSNSAGCPALQARLVDVEADVRQRYANVDRATLAQLPAARAYEAHYKPFGQTYHVLRQLDSVALKGRPLASPAGALVSAMFAAEVRNLLLTAGHDMQSVQLPLLIDVSREGDSFVGINGQQRQVRPGDMLMRDRGGIISAVLYGPDQRTRLTPRTTDALFVTYAPAGIAIETVRAHLSEIADYVRIASPQAELLELAIVP
jgi:DNA/RNA-binding domain of Phe-tRNA-synthetase-like protein